MDVSTVATSEEVTGELESNALSLSSIITSSSTNLHPPQPPPPPSHQTTNAHHNKLKDSKFSIRLEIKFNQLETFIRNSSDVIVTRITSSAGKNILKIETCSNSGFINYNYNSFFRYLICFVEMTNEIVADGDLENQYPPSVNNFHFVARHVSPLGKVISVSFFNEPPELGEIIGRMKRYYLCSGKTDEYLLQNVHNLQISDLFLMQTEQYGDCDNLLLRSRDCKYYILNDELDIKMNNYTGEILCNPCREMFYKMNEYNTSGGGGGGGVEMINDPINHQYPVTLSLEEEVNLSENEAHPVTDPILTNVDINTNIEPHDDGLVENYGPEDIPSSPSSGSWKPVEGDDDNEEDEEEDNFDDQFIDEEEGDEPEENDELKFNVKRKRGRKPEIESDRGKLKKIECVECKLKFRYEKNYTNHLFHIHKKKLLNGSLVSLEHQKIICPLCPDLKTDFPTVADLANHRKEKHLDVKINKREIDKECESTSPSKLKKNYECDSCDKVFTFLTSLTKHQRIVHGINVGAIGKVDKKIGNKRCYFCPRRFTRFGRLGRHLINDHSNRDLSEIPEVQLHNPRASTICDICGKRVLNLAQHKENIHSEVKETPCPICGKKIKKVSLSCHLSTHNKKNWLCTICGTGFSNSAYLQRHSKIHDPDYKYISCQHCGKKFGRQDCLNRHTKSAHSNQRDFECDVCGKGFITKSKLNRHKIIHSTEKLYPCEVCTYSSSRLDNLNTHRIKTHGLTKTTKEEIQKRTAEEDEKIGAKLLPQVKTMDDKGFIPSQMKFNQLESLLQNSPDLIVTKLKLSSGKLILKIETCSIHKDFDYNYDTFFRYLICFVEIVNNDQNNNKFIARQVTPSGKVISVNYFLDPDEFSEILRQMKECYPCKGESVKFLNENAHNLEVSNLLLMRIEQIGNDNENLILKSQNCENYISKDKVICKSCKDLFSKICDNNEDIKEPKLIDHDDDDDISTTPSFTSKDVKLENSFSQEKEIWENDESSPEIPKKNRKRKATNDDSDDDYVPPSSTSMENTSTKNWKPWISGLGKGYISGKHHYIKEFNKDRKVFAKCRYSKTFKNGSICEECPGRGYLNLKTKMFLVTNDHTCDDLIKVKEEQIEEQEHSIVVKKHEEDSGAESKKPSVRKVNSCKSAGFSDWTYCDTGRENKGWMHNGFQYIKDSTSKNRIFLLCRFYKTVKNREVTGTCKGRAVINLETNLFHHTREHQCQGQKASNAKEIEFRNMLKERSEKTTHNLQDVYNEVVSELNLNDDPMIKDLDMVSMIRQMFNWRRKETNKMSHFCNICFKEFDNFQNFKQHQTNDHNLPIRNHSNTGVKKKKQKLKAIEPILINGQVRSICPFCSKQYTVFGQLIAHIRQVHSEINLDEVEEIDDIKKAMSQEKFHCCDECGKGVRNLSRHKMLAHGEIKECEHCNKSFNSEAYRKHMLTHQPKSFLCSQCGEGFVNNQQLNQHFQTKHDPDYVPETFPCQKCDKTFPTRRFLNIHVNNIHTDVNICNICGKKLSTKINLNLHIKSVHTGDKQFVCEECEYCTARLDKFNDHRKRRHGFTKISRADYYAKKVAK